LIRENVGGITCILCCRALKMKKAIYILTLLLITTYNCSDDDTSGGAAGTLFPIDINEDTSSCAENDGLSAESITNNSARLRWFGPSRDFYEVEYGLNGFSQGSGTTVNSNDNDLLVTGLSADTAYDFYVRGNCGGSDFSDWAGPHSFVTDPN